MNTLDKLYIVRRPPIGNLYVIDLTGETYENKVLAASLQGIVNRKSARIYLLDGDSSTNTSIRPWEDTTEQASELFWLNLYKQQYNIKEVWEGNLENALLKFSDDINGYILVSNNEPWTINAGTTIAGITGSLIAFSDQQPLLEAAGIKLKESLIGKWTNSSQCYLDLRQKYYPQMDSPAIAILDPEQYRLRDFLIQQGIFTIFGRPTTNDWPAVKEIIQSLPPNIPVFGYLSLTGEEEFVAITTLSQAGKYLIPTDTTPNLSFHVAVLPYSSETKKTRIYQNHLLSTTVCNPGEVNVTIAISDGDNLAIPLLRYPWSTYWNSSLRGRVPMGWSISPALYTLAPAAMNYYITTTTPQDELIGMLGAGYAFPSFYPDIDFFLSNSFQLIYTLGFPTYWTIDPIAYFQAAPLWDAISRNTVNGYPSGVLVGYGGTANYFLTQKGMPVLMAGNSYADTPQTIAQHITDIINEPASQRPLITFLFASVWSNSYEGLAQALEPFQSQGVHFLLPSEALKCIAQKY